MARTRLKFKLLGVAALLAVVIAAWRLYVVMLLHGPLAGETSHDFGDISLAVGQKVAVDHTFHLTNRTRRPIHFAAAKPECGCVTVSAAPRTIQPGEDFDLPVTMTVSGPSKTVLIHLDLEEAGLQTLKVHAAGRFMPRLFASSDRVILRPGHAETIKLVAAIYDSYDMPAPPRITTPATITAKFLGWQERSKPREIAKSPCTWEGQISLEQSSDSAGAAPDHVMSISIELSPASPVAILLFDQPPSASAPQGEAPATTSAEADDLPGE